MNFVFVWTFNTSEMKAFQVLKLHVYQISGWFWIDYQTMIHFQIMMLHISWKILCLTELTERTNYRAYCYINFSFKNFNLNKICYLSEEMFIFLYVMCLLLKPVSNNNDWKNYTHLFFEYFETLDFLFKILN